MAQQTEKTEPELRQEAEVALVEADRLARRVGSIDDEIAAEREEIAARRVAAAKRGDSPMAAANRDGLGQLLEEREDLPELHFAARLHAAAAHIAVEDARLVTLEAEIEEAENTLAPLAREARVASAKAAAAGNHLAQLEGAREATRDAARRHAQLLQRIESEGVRELS